MIIVHGQATIRAELLDNWKRSASDTLLANQHEEGFVSFSYAADVFEPDLFHVFEIWRDEASFKAHVDAPHHIVRVKKLTELGLYWPQVEYFRADEVTRAAALGLDD